MVPTENTPVIRSNQLLGRIAEKQPSGIPIAADQANAASASIRVNGS